MMQALKFINFNCMKSQLSNLYIIKMYPKLIRHPIIKFGSTRKISTIPYQKNNLSMLPFALALNPQKQQLNSLIKSSLDQICPNINASKQAFSDMQKKVQSLYTLIKNKILNQTDSELDQSFFQKAHYYFQKQGKKVRPLMIIMLAQNFKSIIKRKHPQTNFQKLNEDIKKWCGLMEIMHIASLAHDDIVDDSPSRRGQQSQHLKYGAMVAVFSGNYVISKASKTVSEFYSPQLYEIYAHTMSSLAEGQIKQLIAKGQNKFLNEPSEKIKQFNQMIQRYMQKTYFKSAALMCGSLLGVPTIFQLHFGSLLQKCVLKGFQEIQEISFRAGQHYGLALQLIDDILDYISTAEEMGKEQMADLVQGNVTAPVYLTYKYKQNIQPHGNGLTLQLLNRRKKTKQDAMIVKEWVQSGVGIELTYILGAMHVLEGIKELKKFDVDQEDLLGWRYLGHKLMTRRK